MTGKVTNTRQKKSKQNENSQIILNFAEKPDALPVLTEHLVYRFATDSKIVFICATGVEDGKSAPAQEWPGVEPGCLSLSRCDAHMLDRLAVLIDYGNCIAIVIVVMSLREVLDVGGIMLKDLPHGIGVSFLCRNDCLVGNQISVFHHSMPPGSSLGVSVRFGGDNEWLWD